MLVGTKSFDVERVRELKDNADSLLSYVTSLVPDIYRHNTGIISNQRYYVNFSILQEKSIPIEEKTEISRILVDGIHTVGYLDSFVPVGDIERFVNNDTLLRYREKEGHK